MITCYIRYEIDPAKTEAFENYARAWLALVPRFGGLHHGYWIAHESANDIAVALFSFPSLADYERYRGEIAEDEACQAAFRMAQESGCIRRYDRQFLKPIEGAPQA